MVFYPDAQVGVKYHTMEVEGPSGSPIFLTWSEFCTAQCLQNPCLCPCGT